MNSYFSQTRYILSSKYLLKIEWRIRIRQYSLIIFGKNDISHIFIYKIVEWVYMLLHKASHQQKGRDKCLFILFWRIIEWLISIHKFCSTLIFSYFQSFNGPGKLFLVKKIASLRIAWFKIVYVASSTFKIHEKIKLFWFLYIFSLFFLFVVCVYFFLFNISRYVQRFFWFLYSGIWNQNQKWIIIKFYYFSVQKGGYLDMV